MESVPALSVAWLDPVLRDATAAGLLCDLHGSLVLRHDLTPDGVLRRAAYDQAGMREHDEISLDHGCLSCALREDVLPSLRRLVSDSYNPPTAVVLGRVIPVGNSASQAGAWCEPVSNHPPASMASLAPCRLYSSPGAAWREDRNRNRNRN